MYYYLRKIKPHIDIILIVLRLGKAYHWEVAWRTRARLLFLDTASKTNLYSALLWRPVNNEMLPLRLYAFVLDNFLNSKSGSYRRTVNGKRKYPVSLNDSEDMG